MICESKAQMLSCGLPGVVLRHAGFEATASLRGAQLLSWRKADGSDLLFVNPQADYSGARAIRSGVPVCWPQFSVRGVEGEAALPQHGFARNVDWRILTHESDANHGAKVVLGLVGDSQFVASNEVARLWGNLFMVELEIVLKDNSLRQTLHVNHPESSTKPKWASSMVFHNYFKVADVRTIYVSNLRSAEEPSASIKISGHIDRIFQPAAAEVSIFSNEKPLFKIQLSNISDVVVWNPWQVPEEKRFVDLGADAWQNFICVEPGRISTPISVARGKSESVSQLLEAL